MGKLRPRRGNVDRGHAGDEDALLERDAAFVMLLPARRFEVVDEDVGVEIEMRGRKLIEGALCRGHAQTAGASLTLRGTCRTGSDPRPRVG